MDWLTSLLMGGQPGTIGSPTPPVDTSNPFEPVPAGTPPGGGDVRQASPTQPQPQQSRDNALITALRGVAAPPRPDVVKPSTPGLPHLQAIKAGALFDLLNQVSNPRTAARPPTTLGGALGTGRY